MLLKFQPPYLAFAHFEITLQFNKEEATCQKQVHSLVCRLRVMCTSVRALTVDLVGALFQPR
jgi:hypothetical protein